MSGSAHINAVSQGDHNFDDFYLQLSHIDGFDNAGTATSATETDSTDGLKFVIHGTGLTYDGTTHELTGGSVTGIDIRDGGNNAFIAEYTFSPGFDATALPAAITEFQNSAGTVHSGLDTIFSSFNWTVQGQGGQDQFTGYGGSDFILGSDGADTLSGGAGSDTIVGGGGADILDGGADFDTLSYFYSSVSATTNQAGVTVALGAAGAQAVGHGGDAEGDLFSNFENINGSNYDDSLTGNELSNFINGSGGKDAIHGGDGDDTLQGGAGADALDGGAGTDAAVYSDSVLGVSVTLGAGGVQTVAHGGDAEGDTIISIEYIQGSNGGNDVLIGNEFINDLQGLGGNDTLKGGSGDDFLDGGEGADVIDGGTGSFDQAYYLDSNTAGVTVTLGVNGAQTIGHGGYAEGDKISNIDWVEGTDLNDVLTGNNLANILQGNGGDDLIEGGGGADGLFGGSGDNTLSYSHSSKAVSIDLVGASQGHGSGGDAQGDTYQNFENVIGSNFNDILNGDTAANTINGGGGNDTLSGGDGDDTIKGGAGNDTIEGGAGADTLDGEAGINTLSYAHSSTTGVQIILTDAGPAGTQFGDAAGDVVTNFQNIIGSDFDDYLAGNGAANIIHGGALDDQLRGGGGDDTLDGGDGDDTINGDAGKDTIVGGAGFDELDYGASGTGVTVTLAKDGAQSIGHGGDAEGDKISQIETIFGSSTGDDKLIGNNLGNSLLGNDGNDFLEGGAGADTLYGGAGIDTIGFQGSAAGVTVALNEPGMLGSGSGGDAQGDGYFDVENILGSKFADNLTGFSGDNRIDGDAGDDIVEGRGGIDVLTGGTGNDTLAFTHSSAAVTVTLDGANAASVSGGDAAGETATGFENLIGSDNNDKLTGDGGVNVIEGGLGDDVLDGGGNNDTVSYAHATADVTVDLSLTAQQDTVGAGMDTLSGFENILGSNHDDTLTGSSGINLINGGQGDDTIIGGAGKDLLDGGSGNESNGDTVSYASDTHGITVTLGANGAQTTVTGAAGSDAAGDKISNFENVTGGSGADHLTGNALANTIKGGMGDDVIAGNLGFDHLDGEGGINTLSYAGNIAVNVDLAGGQTITPSNGTDFFSNFTNVIGSSKDDVILGDAAANRIDGGAGNDVIYGDTGDDVLIGGAGSDTVSYQYATGAITVDLTKVGVAQDTVSAGHDTLTGFENVLGGNNDNTITGDNNANVLTGGSGVDHILGGGGNDIINGSGGDDSFDGGTGVNTVTFAGLTSGANVSLAMQGMMQNTGVGNMTLQNFQNLTGTDVNDFLFGDSHNNIIKGGDGGDVIEGGAGADRIDGGAGIDMASYVDSSAGVTVTLGKLGAATTGHGGDAQGDTIVNIEGIKGSNFNDVLTGNNSGGALLGFGGNDFIVGGTSADTLDGGIGIDTISYAASTAGVTVSLAPANTQTVGIGGSAEGDSIENFEIVIGSAHDDNIFLQFQSNVVKVDAGAGNDYVAASHNDQTLIGGAGTDTLDMGQYGSVTVDLSKTAAQEVFGGVMDTISGFENVIGSDHDDILTGTSGNNTFIGGNGSDVITGKGGNDTASYLSDGFAVTVDLKQAGVAQNTGGSGMDTLTGISNLIGSSHDDVLFGDSKANKISGANGDDVIEGGGGADTLDGGYLGAFFNDNDTVSYAGSAAGVTVKLGLGGVVATETGGDAAGDKISNFENITGSANADVLTGNDLDNVIKGGGGNDVIQGGAGIDTLDGEGGINTLSYAGSAVGVTVNFGVQDGTTAQSVQADDASGDILKNFENFIGSTHNDVIIDAFAANKIDGGAGIDTLSYSTFQDFVSVNLALGTAHENGGSDDVILNVENLIGSDQNDTLIGSAGANNIQGGMGDDTIDGGAGNDVLDGGAFDTFGDTLSYASATAAVTVSLAIATAQVTGGAGTDTVTDFQNLTGGKGADHLTGDGGANTIYGGLGADIIEGGGGADNLSGGNFGGPGQNDTVSYAHSSAGVDVDLTLQGHGQLIPPLGPQSGGDAQGDLLFDFANITGSDHDDILTGDSAANTIVGGAGNDTIDGGTGADTLDGGAGIDTLDYHASASNVTVTLGDGAVVKTATGASGSDAIGDKISNFENIFGSAFNDTLTGNKGDNTFVGSGGADKLTGGLGADLFAYNNAAEGGDTITDFVSGTDSIGIAKSTFGGNLTSLGSTLDANYFVAGAAADQAGHGQFIFDATSHNLYWDDDGTGSHAQVLVATFTNNAVVHASDFTLF